MKGVFINDVYLLGEIGDLRLYDSLIQTKSFWQEMNEGWISKKLEFLTDIIYETAKKWNEGWVKGIWDIIEYSVLSPPSMAILFCNYVLLLILNTLSI